MTRNARFVSRTLLLPLLLVALTGTAGFAKPSVAILGIEVIDKQGMASQKDTQVAQELTAALRARARSGGPYALAANGDRELIDQKLIKNCDDERPVCMAAIGTDLGADFLLYGRIEKSMATYNISVVLLDVKRKVKDKTYTDAIPFSESNGVALQTRAKNLYSVLTGQAETCTILVKISGGPDRATIFLNDGVAASGTVSNHIGQVPNLSVGRYKVAIEAPGFRRWQRSDVTCAAGQTAVVTADVTHGDATGPGTGGVGSGSDVSTSLETPEAKNDRPASPHSPWRSAAIGGAIATGVLTTGFGVSWGLLASTGGSKKPGAGPFEYGGNCSANASGDTTGPGLCSSGHGLKVMTFITGIAAGVGFGFTVFALIKAVSTPERAEHAAAKHRASQSTLAVTPVVGPNGAGASLQFDW